jgi:hypothetical protein
MPIVVPPAAFAPRIAAAMTSPSPPVTTTQPRSARAADLLRARLVLAPLPITETCTWRS